MYHSIIKNDASRPLDKLNHLSTRTEIGMSTLVFIKCICAVCAIVEISCADPNYYYFMTCVIAFWIQWTYYIRASSRQNLSSGFPTK